MDFMTAQLNALGDIDLDWEMRRMLSGEWGCWGVLRSFDLTNRSRWWNAKTGEAINGPAWEYTDYLVRMRRVYQPVAAPTPTVSQGVIASYPDSFFLSSVKRPKKEDIIMEIAEAEWTRAPHVVTVLRQHQIMYPDFKLDGKLCYVRAYSTLKPAIRDESITVPLTVDRSLNALLYTDL